MAKRENIQVATEFHGGTLTSGGQSARRLINAVEGARTLWQPLRRASDFELQVEANLSDLEAVTPFLRNVHVYNWADDAAGQTQRLPLESSAAWPLYVEALKQIGGERWMLLEFVPDDDPAILAREAAALRELIGL